MNIKILNKIPKNGNIKVGNFDDVIVDFLFFTYNYIILY